MLKKTIKYTDYNGTEREEDFYFNISKAELMEMQFSVDGGFGSYLDRIIKEGNQRDIFDTYFEKIILKAYGIKSADGKRFEKSDEIALSFKQSEAYSELMMEFMQDAQVAADFVNAILPKLDGLSLVQENAS